MTVAGTIARQLRQAGFRVEQGIEPQRFKQALKYASKKQFPYVLLLGEDEVARECKFEGYALRRAEMF